MFSLDFHSINISVWSGGFSFGFEEVLGVLGIFSAGGDRCQMIGDV